jgi:hypothetical protein
MDVRRASDMPVTVEHEGTCHSYFMFEKESVRSETMGTYLDYLLRGSAVMTIDGEDQAVNVGDLIHIAPNAMHSITDTSVGEGMRALAFAVMKP